jgi:hypothetical protein
MERRLEQRLPLRIGVRVRDRAGRVLFSPTRDISPHGAFIETGGMAFSMEDVLWVELQDSEVDGGRREVAALVAHHHPDGVGVMFSSPHQVFERLALTQRQAQRAYGSP